MSVKYDITSEQLIRSSYRPIHAGDDYDHSFTILRAGSPLDLTSAKVWFTVKEDDNDSDSEAKLQYDSDAADIDITDAGNGQFTIHLSDTDTDDMQGTWSYDIKALLGSGQIIRIARGVIEFLANITQASS